MADDDVRKGTVKWFNDQKGFDFITPDDGGEDLFIHQLAIKSEGLCSLSEGSAVEFVVDLGNDGRDKAANVTVPSGAAVQGSSHGGSYCSRGGCYDGGSRGGGYDGGNRGGGRSYGGDGYDDGGGYGGGGGGAACYNCGEAGHMARDCSQGGGGGGGRYSGGGGGGGCYSCGEDGHFARDCPSSNR